MPENKPKSRRYTREATLELLDITDVYNPRKTGRACVSDISVSGVKFETTLEFSVGDSVILRFMTGKDKIYVLEGTIRRFQTGTGTGIYGAEFKKLSFLDKLKLKNLISKISKT